MHCKTDEPAPLPHDRCCCRCHLRCHLPPRWSRCYPPEPSPSWRTQWGAGTLLGTRDPSWCRRWNTSSVGPQPANSRSSVWPQVKSIPGMHNQLWKTCCRSSSHSHPERANTQKAERRGSPHTTIYQPSTHRSPSSSEPPAPRRPACRTAWRASRRIGAGPAAPTGRSPRLWGPRSRRGEDSPASNHGGWRRGCGRSRRRWWAVGSTSGRCFPSSFPWPPWRRALLPWRTPRPWRFLLCWPWPPWAARCGGGAPGAWRRPRVWSVSRAYPSGASLSWWPSRPRSRWCWGFSRGRLWRSSPAPGSSLSRTCWTGCSCCYPCPFPCRWIRDPSWRRGLLTEPVSALTLLVV